MSAFRPPGRRAAALGLVAVAALLPGCGMVVMRTARRALTGALDPGAEVDAALERFAGHLLRGQAQQAAALFTADGQWLGEDRRSASGPEAIRAALEAPPGSVLAYQVEPKDTRVDGNAATQRGDWRQTVRRADGVSAERQGEFEAQWAKQPDGRWLMRRFRAAPVGSRLPA